MESRTLKLQKKETLRTVTTERQQAALEKILRQEQAGFRKAKSCIDQILCRKKCKMEFLAVCQLYGLLESIWHHQQEISWKHHEALRIPPKILKSRKML